MKLSLEYLAERHSYWRKRIADTGIWDDSLFLPVEFAIRKNHRRYNAVFQRRIKFINGKKEIYDKIVFYNKMVDFTPEWVDNVLVHEMIHQYIIQNDLKDTSPHGRVFKSFLTKLNKTFSGELSIKLKDMNPDLPMEGEGTTIHKLLLLHLNDNKCICAVINPAKTAFFQNKLKTYAKRWEIKSYEWAESNDIFFNRFTRCTTRLHGMGVSAGELPDFCKRYNIKIMKMNDKASLRKKVRLFFRKL